MYIRRKVFSSLMTEEGEERLFSTTDYVYEDERVFSANEEDGFWNSLNKKQKAALITAGTTTAVVGTGLAAHKAGGALKKYAGTAKDMLIADNNWKKGAWKKAQLMEGTGKALQKPVELAKAGLNKMANSKVAVKGVFKKAPKK